MCVYYCCRCDGRGGGVEGDGGGIGEGPV